MTVDTIIAELERDADRLKRCRGPHLGDGINEGVHAYTLADNIAALIAEVKRLREVPPIDYGALIQAAYKRTGAAKGTRGCVQFAKGAEWFMEQVQSPPTSWIVESAQ